MSRSSRNLSSVVYCSYTYIRPSYAYVILQDGIAKCSMDKYNKFLIAGMMEFLLDEGFGAGMKGDVPTSGSEE